MSKQALQRPKGLENPWGSGRYSRSAPGCAWAASQRKNVLKLAPYEVRGEAMKRAQAWVTRRPWLTERERARDLVKYADCFYDWALDSIASAAQDAGDTARYEAAWYYMGLGVLSGSAI